MRRILTGVLVGLAVTLVAVAQTPPPVSAVSPEQVIGQPAGPPLSGAELDEKTDALSSIMRCPVCQALSVNDSPSLSAIAMKEEVRDLLARGYSRQQVITYFEQAYGEFIRLEPKAEGFNLVVWLAPAFALVLGALLVVWRLRNSATPAVAATAPEAELDDYLERVRREVKE